MGDYKHGRFVWRELMNHDVEAAQAFYSALFGWTYETMETPNGPYHSIKAGDRFVGGMMKAPMAQIPAHWSSYLSVDDVRAHAVEASQLGGQILAGPQAVGPGEFASIKDPDGAVFTLWRDNHGDAQVADPPGVGEFCWETLTAPDAERAARFYGGLAGWTISAGPAGPDSHVFSANGVAVADLMVSKEAPCWLTYVVVEDMAQATAQTEASGGKVVVPPFEVPTVGHISLIGDPTGAVLGLFQGAG